MVVIGGIFTSCENDVVESQDHFDDSPITLKSFPKGCVYSESKAFDAGIGSSMERALVPLIFDENGVLCSGETYNDPQFTEPDGERLVTDLKTFRSVTHMKEACVDYVKQLPISENEIMWIFDPYVTTFSKRDSKTVQKAKLLATRAIPSDVWAKKGNIVYARWSGGISDYVGHVGAISQEPNLCGSVSVVMRQTKTIESSNSGSMWQTIIGGSSNGVFERYMSSTGSDIWNHSSVYNRCAMWYPNMTNSQRNAIITYMRNQIGKPYQISSKTNTSKWYCSKLVWRAYKEALNIDIDSDGGTYVFPDDILESPLTNVIYFWCIRMYR